MAFLAVAFTVPSLVSQGGVDPTWSYAPGVAPLPSRAATASLASNELADPDAVDLEMWSNAATYPGGEGDPDDADASSSSSSSWRGYEFMTEEEGTLPWQIFSKPGRDSRVIAGFTDRPSYAVGQTMKISVSTTAKNYNVSFFRLDGTKSMSDPFLGPLATQTDLPGKVQSAVKRRSSTKMTYTTWSTSTTFTIPGDWRPGIYLARLDGGRQSYIPFVIRSTTPARLTVVVPMLTFQAYNRWGGASLYWTEKSKLGAKATAVSFDRPFELSFGASRLFVHGFIPFAGWINKRTDVGWTTDYDLAVTPASLPKTRALVFAGHTEYFPTTLRSWLDKSLASGKFGAAYFSANGAYWPCTMSADAGAGPRVMSCPKTRTWRDAPYSNPEQKLWGSMYGFVTGGAGTFKVTSDAAKAGLLKGTGLKPGSSLGAIAAGEVDQLNRRYPTAGSRIVARAEKIPSLTNSGSRFIGARNQAHMTIRSLSNGRRVWSAASLDLPWAFHPGYAKRHKVPVAAFDRFMKNVLDFVAH